MFKRDNQKTKVQIEQHIQPRVLMAAIWKNNKHKRYNVLRSVYERQHTDAFMSCHERYSRFTHDQRVITYKRKSTPYKTTSICFAFNAPPPIKFYNRATKTVWVRTLAENYKGGGFIPTRNKVALRNYIPVRPSYHCVNQSSLA